MIRLGLTDIPIYKPVAKPYDHHDCKVAGCVISSPQNGVSPENKSPKAMAKQDESESN